MKSFVKLILLSKLFTACENKNRSQEDFRAPLNLTVSGSEKNEEAKIESDYYVNFFKKNRKEFIEKIIKKSVFSHNLVEKLSNKDLLECLKSVLITYQPPIDYIPYNQIEKDATKDILKKYNYTYKEKNYTIDKSIIIRDLLQRNLINPDLNSEYLNKNKEIFNIDLTEIHSENSFYEYFYEKNKTLLPNISISGKVPYRLDKNLNEVAGFISIMYISGYAFNYEDNPDYNFFNQGDFTQENKDYLEKTFKNWFRRIYLAACSNNKKVVYIWEIGLGNLTTKLNKENKEWLQTAFWEAFLNATEVEYSLTWIVPDKIPVLKENFLKKENNNILYDFGYNTGGKLTDLFGEKAEKFHKNLEKNSIKIEDILYIVPSSSGKLPGGCRTTGETLEGMYGYYTGIEIIYAHLNMYSLKNIISVESRVSSRFFEPIEEVDAENL